MSKLKPAVEALTLYTVLHALSHILPLLAVAIGVTEHLAFHNHNHDHSHAGTLMIDTLILTGILHLAIPFLTFYYVHSKNSLSSQLLIKESNVWKKKRFSLKVK